MDSWPAMSYTTLCACKLFVRLLEVFLAAIEARAANLDKFGWKNSLIQQPGQVLKFLGQARSNPDENDLRSSGQNCHFRDQASTYIDWGPSKGLKWGVFALWTLWNNSKTSQLHPRPIQSLKSSKKSYLYKEPQTPPPSPPCVLRQMPTYPLRKLVYYLERKREGITWKETHKL